MSFFTVEEHEGERRREGERGRGGGEGERGDSENSYKTVTTHNTQ